jgi:hypothetical protein
MHYDGYLFLRCVVKASFYVLNPQMFFTTKKVSVYITLKREEQGGKFHCSCIPRLLKYLPLFINSNSNPEIKLNVRTI